MKHAGPAALDRIEPVLAKIRKVAGLTEKKRGVFYRRSQAFLHFHEDPMGLFADLRAGDDFIRFPVNTDRQASALIKRVAAATRI
ncbi:MAG TPA: hypothetical protein VMU16_13635 [Candidatus Binataceae bacterium]|nr:hypothetical protein [Candidatus Binataceae bacterium]